ncbi:class A beta-lactamase [Micromonospora trifolii]|uniref:class A beta-lactamase n=1 Tax=Micromonospora trifolii TaxID=2911208 RepID=UPI003D2EFDA5
MKFSPTRRGARCLAAALAVGLACGLVSACQAGEPAAAPSAEVTASAGPPTAVAAEFTRLETQFGARLGIYAIDTGTGRSIEHRADERFAYASTVKALAAGALLARTTPEQLDRRISYTSSDLVPYSPITEKHVQDGMTLRDLLDAIVRYGDNTAANLIFDALGGPQQLEQDLRAIGDQVTEVEREEPMLNEAVPGDIRDTSTPRAFATDLQKYVLGDALADDDQALLTRWLRGNTTGAELIRAGVPAGWMVGDKTGAASYGTRNDIAVIWPTNGAPIALAIMSSRDGKDAKYDNALIVEASKAALAELTR